MAKDISGESINDVIDMIELWQEEIDLVLTEDELPAGIVVGWTEESGNYVEAGRTYPVWKVAQWHNEGTIYHTEHRYLEETVMWIEDYAQRAFEEAALEHLAGNTGKAVALIQDIGQKAKAYLESLIYEYDLLDTYRLVNSIIVKYTDKDGNILGG